MHMPEERSDSNSCAFLRKSADIGGDVGFCLLACCCLLRFLSFFELDEIGEISMRTRWEPRTRSSAGRCARRSARRSCGRCSPRGPFVNGGRANGFFCSISIITLVQIATLSVHLTCIASNWHVGQNCYGGLSLDSRFRTRR